MTAGQVSLLQQALELCLNKVDQVRQVVGFPYMTKRGVWQTISPTETDFMPAHGSWTIGFTPGMLWLAYRATGREEYAREALERCRSFLHRKDDDTTHDLGFVFYPSYVQGYELTGEMWLRDAAIEAARKLALRYNDAGRYLRAWGALGTDDRAGQTTIDAMMNLALLYWAAEAAREPQLAEIATAHAETSRSTLIRSDKSTYHAYSFDARTGERLGGFTHQGYSDDSTWARGHCWGIYGFERSHQQSRRRDFHVVAEQLADYFLRRLPNDLIPFWDFDDPAIPNAPRDSSAGAIAASALLELAADEEDHEVRAQYRYTAGELLAALYVHSSSRDRPEQEGILLQGTWHRKAYFGIDESLIFGDYYFMEALAKSLEAI